MNNSRQNLFSFAKHVGIIMDGNRRWARLNGLKNLEGHKKGASNVKEILKVAISCQIKYLTLFAFSSENWKRTNEEIQDLIMREKEYAMMNMRNICNYLKRNVNLKQIAEEEAKKLRREAREKALANLVSKNLKKKEKKKPRWLQLYEDSEKRMTRAKQRQMKSKKLSSEALGEKEPKKK